MTSTPRSDLPHIHLVATGGTIAMRLDSDQGGARPAVSGADLVAAVPEVAQITRLNVEEFSNIPLLMLALAAGEQGETLRARFEGNSVKTGDLAIPSEHFGIY